MTCLRGRFSLHSLDARVPVDVAVFKMKLKKGEKLISLMKHTFDHQLAFGIMKSPLL